MNQSAVMEVNKLLNLIGTSRLSKADIIKFDKASVLPVSTVDCYDVAMETLLMRGKYDPRVKQQQAELVELAKLEMVTLNAPQASSPTVNIPIMAIGL